MDIITLLSQKAEQASKVKLYDGYSHQSVKFFGAHIESVDVNEDEYDRFVKHLRGSGWKLIPQVTSGGFVVTRLGQVSR